MDDRKLKEHICKELMDMADEWEIEMERWAENTRKKTGNYAVWVILISSPQG